MSGAPTAGPRPWQAVLRSALSEEGSEANLVGVGNPLRGDDGAGLEVVRRLRSRLREGPSRVKVHPAESMPERLLSRLAIASAKVVIFDAVEASLPPGEIVCSPLGRTSYGFFATHNVPLKLIPGLEPGLDSFYIVGIQPKSLEVGEGLTDEVEKAVDEVVSFVASAAGGAS